MGELLYKDFGRMDYLEALALQERILERKQRETLADVIFFVEHSPVYTLGRGGKASNVLAAREVPVIMTSRGGDVTYHGPGQLVVYPIIDLRSKLRKTVHRYLRDLEMSTIRTLKDFGLNGTRRPPYTGIWMDNRKIAAIGIAVRRGITFHGLALNVNLDLSYFNRIIPCGLVWADVTSMAKELGAEHRLVEVRDRFLHHFAQLFGYQETREGKELLELYPGASRSSEAARESTIGTAGTF
ncbi:MAG TPA: lipoyl(octanoyl) transferase LipB [Candidatus Binatia bacterium]|nr:lipoyl(octanoyl) transferase LipB [Candidatus Binatia bacterium]